MNGVLKFLILVILFVLWVWFSQMVSNFFIPTYLLGGLIAIAYAAHKLFDDTKRAGPTISDRIKTGGKFKKVLLFLFLVVFLITTPFILYGAAYVLAFILGGGAS